MKETRQSLTSDRISQNPAFHQLLGVALEFATAHASVVKDMDLQQRRAYADKANALSAEVKSGAASRRGEAFGDLGALLGITDSDARALTHRAQGVAAEFSAAFPEFASMDEQTKLYTLVEAIKRDPALISASERLVSPAQAASAAKESPQECEALCKALFALFLSVGSAMFVIGLVLCGGSGWIPPLLVLCIIGVVAAYAAYLAILWDIYNGCMANCQEAGPGN